MTIYTNDPLAVKPLPGEGPSALDVLDLGWEWAAEKHAAAVEVAALLEAQGAA